MDSQPPTLAFDLDHDVQVLSAMVSNLTPYLYDEEIYGYLSGDFPRLTLGGLLMRLYRLSRLTHFLNDAQQEIIQNAQHSFETARARWAVHYETRLRQELQNRLNAFEQFLDECGEDLSACASDYPSQAEKRTIIEHLCQEIEKTPGAPPDELYRRLKQLDDNLQHVLQPGEFISDERLQAVYPRETFWWLYGFIGDYH